MSVFVFVCKVKENNEKRKMKNEKLRIINEK